VGYVTSEVASDAVRGTADLPREVKARTFPGLLDLGMAVTAGAAAGYILPRRSATSALPGVGIAVALVPPLATVGITFELGAGAESRCAPAVPDQPGRAHRWWCSHSSPPRALQATPLRQELAT
jgi:hypothetical protein